MSDVEKEDLLFFLYLGKKYCGPGGAPILEMNIFQAATSSGGPACTDGQIKLFFS